MPNRRIAALELLHRVKEQEIDGIGVRLRDIRTEQEKITAEINSLRQRAVDESQCATPETLPYLSGFLGAIERRRGLLGARLDKLDETARSIEDELRLAFVEAKRNEAVLDLARERHQLDEARRENAEAAEIAQNIYLRRLADR
ncbi:hypothetical protein [Shimia sp.]|uniref:hypothetical protein n=1 Tax=Shimia sp. TaxID=1954381 RepID=UPI00356503AA